MNAVGALPPHGFGPGESNRVGELSGRERMLIYLGSMKSNGITTSALNLLTNLDHALTGLVSDLDDRGMLDETLVIAVGEFGRSPQRGVSTSGNSNTDDGRDHWPYCYTSVIAGAGIARGQVYGKSDKPASSPLVDPVHPGQLLATIYHSFGIDHCSSGTSLTSRIHSSATPIAKR